MGDFQRCIAVILTEEGSLALGAFDISARTCAEIAPRPVLPSGFDPLDILLQQLIDELADVDALGLGAGGQIGLHLGFQRHRQVQVGLGLVELAALALGEIDFGGQVIIVGFGWIAHGVHRVGHDRAITASLLVIRQTTLETHA